MVKFSRALLKYGGFGISKTLSEILVCPLSKQPLRLCEETNTLISDLIGVSYPIVDGIPCLVPADGKIIESETDDTSKSDGNVDSPSRTAGLKIINEVAPDITSEEHGGGRP